MADQLTHLKLFDYVCYRGNRIERTYKEDDPLAVKYDNTPISGYRIVVDPYSSANIGSDSVYLVDPRGHHVSISWRAFSEGVQYMTIVDGLIVNECVWGKSGSIANFLIPVDSPLYERAVENTDNGAKKSLKKSELKKGDICKTRDGSRFVYLGTVTTVTGRTKISVSAKEGFIRYSDSGLGKNIIYKTLGSFIEVVGNVSVTPESYITKDGDIHRSTSCGIGKFSYRHIYEECPSGDGDVYGDGRFFVNRYGDAVELDPVTQKLSSRRNIGRTANMLSYKIYMEATFGEKTIKLNLPNPF